MTSKSAVRHYIPSRPFLSTATRGGGNSCCKSDRQPSRAISSVSVVDVSIWPTHPLSFDAPVSKRVGVLLLS